MDIINKKILIKSTEHSLETQKKSFKFKTFSLFYIFDIIIETNKKSLYFIL